MTLPKNIRKSLKHYRVGEHCLHCNSICDASALLGTQIDLSTLMRPRKKVSQKRG